MKITKTEVYVSIAAVIIAIFGIWRLMVLRDLNDQLSTRLDNLSKPSQNNTPNDQNQTPAQPVAQAADYFYLDELGLKFKLSSKLKTDVTTSYYRYSNGEQVEYLYFSTVKWVKLDAACSPAANSGGGVFSIGKHSGTFNAGNANPGESLIKQFSGYYITGGGAQSFCSQNATVKSEWTSVMNEFSSTIKSLEAI